MGFRQLVALCVSLYGSALAATLQDLPRDPAILSYPSLPLEVSSTRTPLLFSDSPETPDRSGLLYRDTLSGPARVLAYHSNGLGSPARVLLFARNAGEQQAQLTVTRQGRAISWGPDPVVGQQTLLRYFASRPRPTRTLAAGAGLVVFDSGSLEPGSVVSLLLDLETTSPVQLSVMILAPGEHPEDARAILDPDGTHQRGTFPGADRTLHARLPAGQASPARLTLSGPDDPPLAGWDVLTGSHQLLKGNFGVLYDVRVEGGAGFLLAASPRGGAYRGSLLVQDGLWSSQLLLGRGRALKDPAAPAPLWHIRSQDLRLQLVPANGSNLPLALVFYPAKVKR